ncbi:MAG TPA: hypothetical protein VMW19_02960, partial [Myxococcota bacterium]|nr:hypothetical protein [Myxococcota bacterium]
MADIGKSLAKTLVGLALVLVWWTLRGAGDAHTETARRIPTVVWDGGAGTLTIHAETTTPAQMRVSFHEQSQDPKARLLETYEDVGPGSHSWTIDVAKEVGGTVELSATSPRPGDRLHWTLEAAGNVVDEQNETLEKPLEPGYGFFIQANFEDFASGELGDG